MSDLLDAVPAPRNVNEVTVSELAASLKRTIEDGYGHVRVRGEISGFRGPHSSGHCYFCLKDDRARLDAVIWRGNAARLRPHLVEGLDVVATGKLTTFAGKSTYQIVVEALEPAGVGALMAMLEERRKRLGAEGLFDERRKRALPFLPNVIGVVTSPTGAVIRDILHRLSDRFPSRVVLWPVRVQGETSAAEVAGAIRGLNALRPGDAIPRPDLLIVARGGGSLEDLWSFNEEIVVRAAADSAIPVISAVGHETDWTLLDLVADHRAPTPTAAAERAVPVRRDLIVATSERGLRLQRALSRRLDGERTELRSAIRGLGDAESLVAMPRQSFDDLAARLPRALLLSSREQRGWFDRLAGRLTWRGLAAAVSASRRRFEGPATRLTPGFVLEPARRDAETMRGLHARSARALGVLVRHRRQAFDDLAARLPRALHAASREHRGAFEPIAARLTPGLVLDGARRDTEEARRLSARAARAFDVTMRERRARAESLVKLLESLGYRNVLARGFALARDAEGHPLRSVASARPGTIVSVELADGRFEAEVVDARTGAQRPKQMGLFER